MLVGPGRRPWPLAAQVAERPLAPGVVFLRFCRRLAVTYLTSQLGAGAAHGQTRMRPRTLTHFEYAPLTPESMTSFFGMPATAYGSTHFGRPSAPIVV